MFDRLNCQRNNFSLTKVSEGQSIRFNRSITEFKSQNKTFLRINQHYCNAMDYYCKLTGISFNYLPIWFLFPLFPYFFWREKINDIFNNNKSLLATQIKISTHYVLILFFKSLIVQTTSWKQSKQNLDCRVQVQIKTSHFTKYNNSYNILNLKVIVRLNFKHDNIVLGHNKTISE